MTLLQSGRKGSEDKAGKGIEHSSLQSPDDLEATWWEKGNQFYKAMLPPLAFFLVNLSQVLLRRFQQNNSDFSILDLKAH